VPIVYRCTPEERTRIAAAIAAALNGEPTVDFAYLHGSFLDTQPFHDIDVAVMLTSDAGPDITGAALALGDRLERIVKHPIDVRALNRAPLTFQFKAARGRLLVCRDDDRVATFVEHLLPRYFDLAPRLDRATREAFAS
jgi:predicted nucleotidyltransferase